MTAKLWFSLFLFAVVAIGANSPTAIAQRLTADANADEGDEPAEDSLSLTRDDDSQMDNADADRESSSADAADEEGSDDASLPGGGESGDADDVGTESVSADSDSDSHAPDARGERLRLTIDAEESAESDANDEAETPHTLPAAKKKADENEPAPSPFAKQRGNQKNDPTANAKRPLVPSPLTKPQSTRPQPKRDESPRPLRDPNAAVAPTNAGKPYITKAFTKTKTAADEPELTEILDLCHAGLDTGLSKENAAYARRLMAWAHNRRGELRADAGNGAAAREDFEAAVTLDPKHWRAVHNRGVSFAGAGDLDSAIADLNRTLQMNPKFSNGFFNRGELRYDRGEFQQAIADYTEAIRLNPKDSGAYNSRGHAHYRLNQFRPALADYAAAIRIDPNNAAAYTNRGDTQADLGSYAEAVKDYQTAVKVNPRLGRAYQSAAWLMATCPDAAYRDEQRAVETAEKAIELDGDDSALYLETLAAAQASAGQFDEAAQTQQRAVKLIGDSDRGRAKRRLALYKKGLAFRDSVRAGATANAPKGPQRPSQR